MDEGESDTYVRAAAIAFLDRLRVQGGDAVRFDDMAQFEFQGIRIPFMDGQLGIRKPRQLDSALSIRTVHASRPDQRPYDDEPGPDGRMRYKWRGTDPDHPDELDIDGTGGMVDLAARRRYAGRIVDVRLHQPLFRVRVLHAYERRCALCRLRHVELLDAAHIVSDCDGGEPVVTNGIAMCKIHHAARPDRDLLTVRYQRFRETC